MNKCSDCIVGISRDYWDNVEFIYSQQQKVVIEGARRILCNFVYCPECGHKIDVCSKCGK